MAVITSEQFLEAAQTHNVVLHPDVERFLLRDGHSLGGGENARVFNAVGDLAIYSALEPLAEGEWLNVPPEIEEDLPANTLVDLINFTVLASAEERSTVLRPWANAVEEPTVEHLRFIDAVRSIGQVSSTGRLRSYGVQVITKGNKPTMIRKGAHQPTGLTLVEAPLEDITLPAGSIVDISIDHKGHETWPRTGNLDIIEAERVTSIQFARLSRLALTPEARAETFDDNLDVVPTRLHEFYRGLTMGQILDIVEGAITKVQSRKAA